MSRLGPGTVTTMTWLAKKELLHCPMLFPIYHIYTSKSFDRCAAWDVSGQEELRLLRQHVLTSLMQIVPESWHIFGV